MLFLPPSVRIFVSSAPADMRWSFDRLSALAKEVLGQDPFSGHLFVFAGRRRDRVKILWWDRGGFCLWYKRIERGTFRFPDPEATYVEFEGAELAMLLEGIDLAGAKRRKRFVPAGTDAAR